MVTPVASHYPDVVVTCSSVDPAATEVPEPVVIAEVLSRTTADRDRGAKWTGYQDIASLQHYVLIWQSERRVELITRQAKGWHLDTIRPPEARVELAALKIGLSPDVVYEDSGT